MTAASAHETSTLKSWVIISLLALLVLFKGVLAFTVIGDLGQPDWDYRPVKDIPAESPYAVYDLLPYQQHVRGDKGE